MAAMKPRTGDGPLDVSTEGGGRLVIEMSAQEAGELAEALTQAI